MRLRGVRAGLYTLQTAGTRDELGEAAELAPGVTSPPAPQPATLWTGSGSSRRPGSSRLACEARPGLRDRAGCDCGGQIRESPLGPMGSGMRARDPPSVERLGSEPMVTD